MPKAKRILPPRNGNLFDGWSIVHLIFGIAFGYWLDSTVAVILLVLWEPFEIFILSPLLYKVGIIFGRESLRNSLSDIVFDITGVLIAILFLA